MLALLPRACLCCIIGVVLHPHFHARPCHTCCAAVLHTTLTLLRCSDSHAIGEGDEEGYESGELSPRR